MFSCNKDSFNKCSVGPTGPTGPSGIISGNGNLDLSCNSIIDVSDIDFCQNIVLTAPISSNIAIGNNAGYSSTDSIAIGNSAGETGQNIDTIAIGRDAGKTNQGTSSNFTNLAGHSIAIGHRAGQTNQSGRSIAVGLAAAQVDQSRNAIAVGLLSGYQNQGQESIAIGTTSAFNNQKQYAVAMGYNAGQNEQGEYGVAIGYQAGSINQGKYSVAIGYQAGQGGGGNIQQDNSIVLNAESSQLSADFSNAFYVKPIRNISNSNSLYYNSVTGEITYDTAGSAGGGAWDPSFNYYFMRKPWPPVYVNGGTFTPPSSYNRGIFDSSSGQYDPVDQRIELNWLLPPREAAAFNFAVAPRRLNDGTINLTNSGASLTSQQINDASYNYLPYHETLHIDIRTKNGTTISNWNSISTTDLALTAALGVRPNLYAQTRGAYFVAGSGTTTGNYGPISGPPIVPIFVYQNSNLLQLGSTQYQFRIYLKNKSEEVLPSPDYFGTLNPEWNYLYMPDNSGSYFVFGNFGPATPPQLITLAATDYRRLNISGANNFPNSSNPYADMSLNTPFFDLSLYGLHVNYGFDLSGSLSPASLQFQTPPTPV